MTKTALPLFFVLFVVINGQSPIHASPSGNTGVPPSSLPAFGSPETAIGEGNSLKDQDSGMRKDSGVTKDSEVTRDSGVTKDSEVTRDSGVMKALEMSKVSAEAGKVTAKDTEGRKETTSLEVNQEQARARRENKASEMSKVSAEERKASEMSKVSGVTKVSAVTKDSVVMKASATTKDSEVTKDSEMSKVLADLGNPSSAVASIDSCWKDLIPCLVQKNVFSFSCEFLA
ncbi:MAG: hypothetical protein P8175_02875 [Deltaproteobacteria bacterium]